MRIIRQRKYTKAHHVTVLVEYTRQYGSQSKSKEVAGTVLEYLGKKAKYNWLITYVKSIYALGGETLKTMEMNIISVLKAPNNPQYILPEVRQVNHWALLYC